MPIYDYNCVEHGKFEAFKPMSQRDKAACPHCGSEAPMVVSAPAIMLDGTDPGFPGAYDKWARKRNEKMAQERKLEE